MYHVMDIDICFEVERNVEGKYTDCGICHENYNDNQLKSVSFIFIIITTTFYVQLACITYVVFEIFILVVKITLKK